MFRKFFKDYFTFSRGERNGILILLIVIALLIILRIILPGILNPPGKRTDFHEFEGQIEQFEQSLQPGEKAELPKEKLIKRDELFYFDPNLATREEWERLGIKPEIITIIRNYLEKGGRFRTKRDLLKIYGFTRNDYERLEAYITIEDADISSPQDDQDRKSKLTLLIPVNNADTSQLMRVNGIGPVLSNRIVKYRNLLGGYIRKEQLLEVYGMTEERYRLVVNKIYIDTTNIRRININTANSQILSEHPYLNQFQAEAIVAYRDFAGSFRNIDEILEHNLLPYEVFTKIKGYLCLK